MYKMYGSTHTHLEDQKDAVTDMRLAIRSFLEIGAKKVAATGHGVFTEYESAIELVNAAKAWAKEARESIPKGMQITEDVENQASELLRNGRIDIYGHAAPEDVSRAPGVYAAIVKRIEDFEIIPGVEAYFGERKKHMILIAKNNEGYVDLSRVISASADYAKAHEGKEINDAIVTLENLRENVRRGNIICTTACINGVFGNETLSSINTQKKIDELVKELPVSLEEAKGAKKRLEDYDSNKKAYRAFGITKALSGKVEKEEKRLRKFAEEIGLGFDRENVQSDEAGMTFGEWYRKIEEREVFATRIEAYEQSQKEMDEETLSKAKEGENANGRPFQKTSIILNKIEKHEKELEELFPEIEEKGFEKAKKTYEDLVQIFGEENFFFEIQNHGIKEEETIYNGVINLALKLSESAKFIAANDTHVCVTKENKSVLETNLLKRNVAEETRFRKYSEITDSDRELIIKSDEDLKEALLKGIKPATKPNGDVIPAEVLIENAIGNIRVVLSGCHIEHGKEKHYPKFCENENEEFEKQVEKGFAERFKDQPQEYAERIRKEISVIEKMGYAGYHLIVADYIKYGKLLGYLREEDLEAEAMSRFFGNEDIHNGTLTMEQLERYVNHKVGTGEIKKIGLGVGPGRGSAAGSLVCMCLGITDVDPIKQGLLFERFLNEERVSMPDIDVDFSPAIRSRVYDYCSLKYGVENVSKIVTKSYFHGKGAIRAAGRYLLDQEIAHNNLQEGEPLANEAKKKYLGITDVLTKKYTALEKKNLEQDKILPTLMEESMSNEVETKILEYSKVIDGSLFGYGQHAGGVIISDTPIRNVVPLMWNQEKESYSIQCEMGAAEAKGLLKMDFLGLKNLGIITEIVKYPSGGKDPIDLFQTQEGMEKAFKDKSIYKDIFSTGDTVGVFQFDSPGMKRMLRNFQPKNFDDIVLLVALYRPGPMSYIDEITARKWEKEGRLNEYMKKNNLTEVPERSITLNNPVLNKILEPTYGCPVYQEQIMQIFQEMAGYSLGGADVVRRYMSKKKVDKLAYEKDTFIHGDPSRGIEGVLNKFKGQVTEEEADNLFEQMMPFAKYGFNKSHAAAYTQVAVETAYLKKHRPVDFYKATLNYCDDLDAIKDVLQDIKNGERGISVIPIDINAENKFSVRNGNTIVPGFSNVKGMGALNIKVRTKNAQEFIEKNPDVSLSDIQTLAKLGVFETTWSGNVPDPKYDTVKRTEAFVEEFGELLRSPDSESKAEKIEKAMEIERKLVTKRESDSDRKYLCENIEQFLGISTESPELMTLQIAVKQGIDEGIKSRQNYIEGFKDAVSTSERGEVFLVPAYVEDAWTEEKGVRLKTKSGNEFAKMKLVDQFGNKITRRCGINDVPGKGEVGVFQIFDEDHAFFIPRGNVKALAIEAGEEKAEEDPFVTAFGSRPFEEMVDEEETRGE